MYAIRSYYGAHPANTGEELDFRCGVGFDRYFRIVLMQCLQRVDIILERYMLIMPASNMELAHARMNT